MSKPLISKFLKRQDRLVWSRFLSSPEGIAGLTYLRLAFPKKTAVTEADLIKNGVGFEFWVACIEQIEELGDVPVREDNAENADPLER